MQSAETSRAPREHRFRQIAATPCAVCPCGIAESSLRSRRLRLGARWPTTFIAALRGFVPDGDFEAGSGILVAKAGPRHPVSVRWKRLHARDLKQLTDFLVNLGIEQVAHTQKNYLAHLISVCKLMQTSGCDEDLCLAGLFHSIYGTEKFQGFKLPAGAAPRTGRDDRQRRHGSGVLEFIMDRPLAVLVLGESGTGKEAWPRRRGSASRTETDDFGFTNQSVGYRPTAPAMARSDLMEHQE